MEAKENHIFKTLVIEPDTQYMLPHYYHYKKIKILKNPPFHIEPMDNK